MTFYLYHNYGTTKGGLLLPSSLNTVIGATFHNVPLVTETRVPLSPRGSPKHQTIERPLLVDKDDAQETKGEGVRALNRRRRQEAPSCDIDSSKGIESMELLEF